MRLKTTGFWLLSVIAAGAIGWFAAMEVNRGPAFTSEQDAYDRFSKAFTVTDTMERIEVVDKLVRRLTPEALPGAVRALKDDVFEVYNYDLRMVMWYWANQDPHGMLRDVMTWSDERAMRMAAGEAIAGILRKDGYDTAHALFEQLPSNLRTAAIPNLVLAYLESGLTPNLIQLIESHQSRDERDLVTGIVTGQILYLNGPQAVADWVESLPPGSGVKSDIKAVAFRQAISELMLHDKLEFVDSWLARIEKEPWASGGRRAVAVNLAKRRPLEAIAWAQALTPEQGRDEIFSETLRTFAAWDRDGAVAWLRGQEPDARLDAGVVRISYELALRNPKVALEMAARVQDPAQFALLRENLTREWKSLAEDDRVRMMAELDKLASAREVAPARKNS